MQILTNEAIEHKCADERSWQVEGEKIGMEIDGDSKLFIVQKGNTEKISTCLNKE